MDMGVPLSLLEAVSVSQFMSGDTMNFKGKMACAKFVTAKIHPCPTA